MKALTFIAALAALTAFAGTERADAFASKRARNELLAARFAPSCAQLRVFFRMDRNGEPPECRVQYYCPGCRRHHDSSVEEFLREERPLEGAAFALAPNRFLVQDLHLLPEWIDRIEIVFGGRTYAAKEVRRYSQENAVELETAEGVAGVRPLEFSKRTDFLKDGDGVFFFATKDNGLAVCGTRRNDSADFVRYGDISRDVVSAEANTIAVNCSNEAVTVFFRTKFAADGQAFRPPAEWTGEPIAAFEGRLETMKKTMLASLVPLYVHLDDEDNRKDGYSRRYRTYREDSEATDLDLVGFVLPDGEVVAALNLDASKMSEIDKIEAVLPDGKRVPLEFVGALADVKLSVFRFADGKTPPGLRPLRLDARRPETRFLEPAYAFAANNYNGAIKAKLASFRLETFEVGRGGECLPYVPTIGGYRAGVQSMLVYPDGTFGGVRVQVRTGERYSRDLFLSAAKFACALAERDFDPQFAIRQGKDRVRIAWIGVETQRMTDDLAREKKASALLAAAETGGALVTRVWEGSPAAKAGLRTGDILLTARLAKSQRVQTLEDEDTADGFDWSAFFEAMGFAEEDFGGVSPWPNVERGVNRTFTDLGIGKKVIVAYARGGERKEAEMTLEQAPVHYQTAKRVKNKALGMIVSDMTFEVRGYFKFAADAPGVVIVKVQPGNPAEIAGLRPLEIITHVNNEPVTSAKDFARKVKGRKDLTFAVRRLAATRVVRIEMKESQNEK